MRNLQLPLLMGTLVSVFFAQTVLAQEMSRSENPTKNREIRSLRQIKLPITNASQLLSQSPPQTTSPIQVTGIRLSKTDKGIEVILETKEGDKLQPASRTEANNLIIDIPNSLLVLPNGQKEFRNDRPIEGIASVTVTQLDGNITRVTVTGNAGVPQAELFDSDEGLIFGLIPVTSTTQNPSSSQSESPPPLQKPEGEASGNEPIELVVTGEQDGYNAPNTSTATKTDTPLRDIPQSIQVVPQEVIKDQQITKISDAARNVSGVSPSAGFGGVFDDYTIRGFLNYNVLRNGFKVGRFFDYGANVERVEVLKGPASVLYGQFEPGGTVNYVTKQPLSNPYYAAEFTVGSFNFYRSSIDLSGPLSDDKKLLYRLNVAYENSGSYRDLMNYDIFSVSPVITYKPSENTTLNFEYEYGRRYGGFDRGFPPTDPVFLTLPVSRYLGEPGSTYNVDYHQGTLTVDHRFSDSLQLRSGVSVRSSLLNAAYINIAGGIFEADGRSLQRSYAEDRDRRNEEYSWQTDLIAKFKTGSIGHQLLLGFELSRSTEINPYFRGDIASLDIFNPVYGARPTNIRRQGVDDTKISTTGIYLQDQVTLLPNLKLLVGGRYDFVDSDNSSTGGDGNTTKSEFYDGAFSPRVGLVYQPIEPISLYASYSRSFVPNNATTVSGESLEPSRGTQYEVGIKSELFDGKLSATLAAYDITKTNIPTVDPNNTDFSIAVGEVKSRGIELDVAGEILPGWKIIASGYLNDAFVSKDNSIPEGRRLENTAYHGASLWTTYQIQKGDLQGLAFSAGLFFVGSRIANQSDPFTLPSYVRTDAAISYKRDNWRAALNFKNIFDVKYYDTNGYLVFPQAPLTVLGTISVEF